MSLPEFNFGTVFLLVVVWTAVAVVFGLLIGKCIDEADTCDCGHSAEAHQHYRPGSDCALCDCGSDETWLDDAPTVILSDDEIRHRCERLESQFRHPSGREFWL